MHVGAAVGVTYDMPVGVEVGVTDGMHVGTVERVTDGPHMGAHVEMMTSAEVSMSISTSQQKLC